MRTVKMTEIIGASVKRAKEILFCPFSSKKWLKLLLIAALAGALGGTNMSGGGHGGGASSPARQGVDGQGTTQGAAAQGAVQKDQTTAPAADPALTSAQPQKANPAMPKVIIFVIGGIIALFLALFICFSWLWSRFTFIWFNSAVNNTADISEPYSRHARQANSFFKFFIIMFASMSLVSLSMIAWTIYKMNLLGVFKQGFVWSFPTALDLFLLPGIIIFVLFFVYVLVSFFAEVFVAPIMALDDSTVGAGFSKFGGIFRSEWRDICVFILVYFLLGIASGAAQAALAIVAFLLFLLIAAIVFGIPFLLIVALLKAKMVFIVYAIVLGVPFIICGILFLVMIGLPFAVFFRVFSVNYLISLDKGYTQQTLDAYAQKKSDSAAKKAPIIIAIVALALAGVILLVGILAAIAVPNFIAARDKALQKKATVVTNQ